MSPKVRPDPTCPANPAEALIDDINTDVKVALNCLQRPAYAAFASSTFFSRLGPVSGKPENKHLNIE